MNITLLKLSQFSIILIGIAILYVALDTFQGFLRPFSIALLLTFLTVGFFRLPLRERLLKLSYFLLSITTTIALLVVLLTASGADSQEELEASTQLIVESSQTQSNILEELQEQFNQHQISSYINYDEIESIAQNFLSVVLGSISVFLSDLFLIILFYIFLIPSYDRGLSMIKKTYFSKNYKDFEDTFLEIEKGIKSYLGIKILISLATSIVSGIILALFGAENILLLMIIIFALNFIPNIGSFIAVFIAVGLFAIQIGFTLQLLIFAILLTSVQVIFGSIIEPKIAGTGLNMPPILILLSLFFWGSLWGLGGMLISVPLTHAIKTVISKLIILNKSVKHN